MRNTPNVLQKIAAYKAVEVAELKKWIGTADLKAKALASAKPRGFKAALDAAAATGPALIAEVKKASPSKGIIREDFDPVAIAKAYTDGGAACLSVLTDMPSFQGSMDIFRDVRAATDLPLLRKDFMLDPIQIYEAREAGADAILIIMAMIDDKVARQLIKAAKEMGLDALVETHDETELARAIVLGSDLIGINNRDLRTFDTTLDTFTRLASKAPVSATLVAESGIFTPDHILRLAGDGAKAYLVGESLMRQDDVKRATEILMGSHSTNYMLLKDFKSELNSINANQILMKLSNPKISRFEISMNITDLVVDKETDSVQVFDILDGNVKPNTFDIRKLKRLISPLTR